MNNSQLENSENITFGQSFTISLVTMITYAVYYEIYIKSIGEIGLFNMLTINSILILLLIFLIYTYIYLPYKKYMLTIGLMVLLGAFVIYLRYLANPVFDGINIMTLSAFLPIFHAVLIKGMKYLSFKNNWTRYD